MQKELIQTTVSGKLVDLGWIHREDFATLKETVLSAEEILGVTQGYNIFLYPQPPVLNGKQVEYGGFVTFQHNVAPPCIFIVDNFSNPGHYAIKNKDGSVVYSLRVERDDLVIANLGEEIFHLSDYRKGNIPTGSNINNTGEKYDILKGVPFEIQASLFRVGLLSKTKPTKWFLFNKFVNTLIQSKQQFSVIWES